MTRTKPEGGGPRSKKLKATATGQIPFNSQFLSDAFQRVVDAAGSAQEALKQGHGYAGLEALVSAALRLGPIKVRAMAHKKPPDLGDPLNPAAHHNVTHKKNQLQHLAKLLLSVVTLILGSGLVFHPALTQRNKIS
jgi:hypothetical protein